MRSIKTALDTEKFPSLNDATREKIRNFGFNFQHITPVQSASTAVPLSWTSTYLKCFKPNRWSICIFMEFCLLQIL